LRIAASIDFEDILLRLTAVYADGAQRLGMERLGGAVEGRVRADDLIGLAGNSGGVYVSPRFTRRETAYISYALALDRKRAAISLSALRRIDLRRHDLRHEGDAA